MDESVDGQDFEEGKQVEDYVVDLTKELDSLPIPGENDKPVEQPKTPEKVEPKKADPQPAISSSQDAVTMKIQTPPAQPPIQTPPIQEAPKPAPTPQPIVEVKTSKDLDFLPVIDENFSLANLDGIIKQEGEKARKKREHELYSRIVNSLLNPPLPPPQPQVQTVTVSDQKVVAANESALRRIDIELMGEDVSPDRRKSLMKVKADLLGMPYIEEPLPTLKMQGPPQQQIPKQADQPKIVDVKPKKKQREYGPKVIAAVFALSVIVGFAIFFVVNMGH